MRDSPIFSDNIKNICMGQFSGGAYVLEYTRSGVWPYFYSTHGGGVAWMCIFSFL